jgi:hypothetical protein
MYLIAGSLVVSVGKPRRATGDGHDVLGAARV